jgi:hypothetical protein
MQKRNQVDQAYIPIQRRGGPVGLTLTDIVFVSGKPVAVIEWKVTATGDVPIVTVPLDPAQLKVLSQPAGRVRFLYQSKIADPRPLD